MNGNSGDNSEPALFNYYDYTNRNENLEPDEPIAESAPPCYPTADNQLFHICIAAISLVVMFILAALSSRKRLCKTFQGGSTSVFSPLNFLDHSQHKGLAVAVFGLVFCKLCVLVLAPNPLPFVKESTPATKELWKILAIFYYPALYYPLLVCGTLRNKIGYLLGGLLSWAHFAILCWQKIDCPKTPEIYQYYSLLNSLPQIVCLAFLSFQYPRLLFKELKSDGKTSTSENLDNSYYKDYVKSILKKKTKTSSTRTEKPSLTDRILDVVKAYIYTPEEGFQLPVQLVISGVVSFIAVYQVTLLLISAVVPILHIVRAGINEDIAFLLLGFKIILHEDRQEVVKIVIHYTWCLEVCYICATTLSCWVSLVMLSRSMVLHRSNLRGLYRGDVYNVNSCQRRSGPSQQGVVSWMGFTSYQAAVICLGMAIQTLVFLFGFVFVIFLVIIPILSGQNLMFFHVLGKIWPFLLLLFLVVAVQHVTAQFAFVKKDAGTRDLANRSGLFLLSYLLFLVNVMVGLLVGLWRMVVTALYNIVHLGRIDISLINRDSEFIDPGYRCYAHFLKLEVSQAHPVMKAFCGLLLHSAGRDSSTGQKLMDAEEACTTQSSLQLVQQEKRQSRVTGTRRAQLRWMLLLTLVNNPSLLGSRKHFQPQASDSALNVRQRSQRS